MDHTKKKRKKEIFPGEVSRHPVIYGFFEEEEEEEEEGYTYKASSYSFTGATVTIPIL